MAVFVERKAQQIEVETENSSLHCLEVYVVMNCYDNIVCGITQENRVIISFKNYSLGVCSYIRPTIDVFNKVAG